MDLSPLPMTSTKKRCCPVQSARKLPTQLLDLPDDVLCHIFTYLSCYLKALKGIGSTNHHLRKVFLHTQFPRPIHCKAIRQPATCATRLSLIANHLACNKKQTLGLRIHEHSTLHANTHLLELAELPETIRKRIMYMQMSQLVAHPPWRWSAFPGLRNLILDFRHLSNINHEDQVWTVHVDATLSKLEGLCLSNATLVVQRGITQCNWVVVTFSNVRMVNVENNNVPLQLPKLDNYREIGSCTLDRSVWTPRIISLSTVNDHPSGPGFPVIERPWEADVLRLQYLTTFFASPATLQKLTVRRGCYDHDDIVQCPALQEATFVYWRNMDHLEAPALRSMTLVQFYGDLLQSERFQQQFPLLSHLVVESNHLLGTHWPPQLESLQIGSMEDVDEDGFFMPPGCTLTIPTILALASKTTLLPPPSDAEWHIPYGEESAHGAHVHSPTTKTKIVAMILCLSRKQSNKAIRELASVLLRLARCGLTAIRFVSDKGGQHVFGTLHFDHVEKSIAYHSIAQDPKWVPLLVKELGRSIG